MYIQTVNHFYFEWMSGFGIFHGLQAQRNTAIKVFWTESLTVYLFYSSSLSLNEYCCKILQNGTPEMIWAISYEIMVLFVLRKLILQTCMCSHPVGLDVWLFGWTLRLLPYFMCANSEGSGLAWAFAGRLCDKYLNLMSWLIYVTQQFEQYSFRTEYKSAASITWYPATVLIFVVAHVSAWSAI